MLRSIAERIYSVNTLGKLAKLAVDKASRFAIIPPAYKLCNIFLGSSMAEHATVNRRVAGSNPARGAKESVGNYRRFFVSSQIFGVIKVVTSRAAGAGKL